MSVNLLETVQKNLGYPPLKKIDPNTQEVKRDEKITAEDQFSQAAIPAVLTAFYRYVQSDEGATEFLRGNYSSSWAARIFDNHGRDAIQTISEYAKQCNLDPMAKINAIADETVKVVKQNLGTNAGIREVKDFFINQRNNILPYLSPSLKMGEFLNDNTLDDNTNKMEGPISNLIKNIGNAFSNPVTEEEMKSQEQNK